MKWINQIRNQERLRKQKQGLYTNRLKHQRFYQTKAWQHLRLVVLSENPICVICNRRPATEVDHIESLTAAWHLRLSYSNCQSLCSLCHKRKTRQEQKERQDKEQQQNIDDYMNNLNNYD